MPAVKCPACGEQTVVKSALIVSGNAVECSHCEARFRVAGGEADRRGRLENLRSRRPTRNGAPSSHRSSMRFCAKRVLSAHGRARCSRSTAKVSSPVPVAICRCSPRRRNSRAVPAGPVFTSRSRMPSAPPRTEPSAYCGPKFIAAAVAAISVTSSTMGPSRPACATAWTGLRWCFIRRRHRRAEVYARQLLPARQLCPGLWTGAFSFKYLK